MAVIQISKIQVRRGLQENLPQLAGGEFGWSVDTQKLYIGNGTLTEGAPEIGNTEIVTANTDILDAIRSYTFKGTESGYTSKTGSSANIPVQRSLQAKLDEQISLRDFVTTDDSDSDDYTEALQRALDQIYPEIYYATTGVRRIIHIPAGVWSISDTITLPPYTHLVGDGPDATIIKQTSIGTGNPSFLVRDSKQQTGTDMGTSSADLPHQISLSNMTLQNGTSVDEDILVIDSADNVYINKVKFLGSDDLPLTSTGGKAGVRIQDTVGATTNVTLNQCEFTNITYGTELVGDVNSVSYTNCSFKTLFQGVNLLANVASPSSVRVVGSLFDEISEEAVWSDDTSSFVSAFNQYKSVGYGNGTVIVSPNPTTSVMYWESQNNYSIGDVFERSLDDQTTLSLFSYGNTTTSLTHLTSQGTVQDYPGWVDTLEDGATNANTSLVLTSVHPFAIIDYSIYRANVASDGYRIGTITVTNDGTSIDFEDSYSERNDMGVTFGFASYGNDAVLTYSTTSTTYDATFKYTIRSFV